MAQQARKTTKKSGSTRTASARKSGEKALKRLHDSVDAAEAALKDVRKEMSRGSKSLLSDVETTLRTARKNLRSVSRHVAKDLEEVQRAATGKRKAPAKRTTQKAKTKKRSTATTRRKSTRAGAAKK